MTRAQSIGHLQASEGVVQQVKADGSVVVIHRRKCTDCGGTGVGLYGIGHPLDPDGEEHEAECHECLGEGHTDDGDCGCDACSDAKDRLEAQGVTVVAA